MYLNANPRRKIIITLIMLMLILIGISVISMNYMHTITHHEDKLKYTENINKIIDYEVNQYVRDYSYHIQRILSTLPIAAIIKDNDREKLYTTLEPEWKLLGQKHPYLIVMHIHQSDGTSFLRMHKPDVYGDDIASIRPMLEHIRTSQQPVTGYEQGIYLSTYRIIYPILDDAGEYTGAFEIGLHQNFIFDAIHDMLGYDGIHFEKDNSHSKHDNDKFLDHYKVRGELREGLRPIAEAVRQLDVIDNGTEISVNEKNYTLYIKEANNFLGTPEGQFLFIQTYKERSSFSSTSTIILASLLLVGLASFFIYRQVSRYQDEVSELFQEQIDQLNESEQRFRLLYNNSPDMYVSVSAEDGSIILCNDTLIKKTGYTREEIIGAPIYMMYHEDCLEDVKDAFSTFVKTGAVKDKELTLKKKDGSTIEVSLNVSSIRDETGKVIYSMSSWRDITEIKKSSEALEFQRLYLQNIFDATPTIMITTEGEFLSNANNAMLDFFDYKTLEEFHKEYDCICDLFMKGKGFLQADMDGINWLEYIYANPSLTHKVSMLKDGKPHTFVVWVKSLPNGTKHRSIVTFTDVTQLEETIERYEYAIRGTQDGLWDWDIKNNEVYFSPRWKGMLGYADDELKNELQTWVDLVHPDDLEEAEKSLNYAQETPGRHYENIHRLKHKDGHWVWNLDRGETLFNEKKEAIRMIGFHTDISKQKNLENELRSAQKVFSQFMENIPAYIVIKDHQDKIIYTNTQAADFFKKETLIGLDASDLLPKEYTEIARQMNKEAIETGFVDIVAPFIDKKGIKYYFRILTFSFKQEGSQNLRTASIYLDITNTYKHQEEIKKLQSIIDKAPVNIMITDLQGNIEYVNNTFISNSNYSAEELIGSNPRILKSEYTSAEEYKQLWKTITSGKIWSGVFKNIKKTGESYWSSAIIAPILNEQGSISNYLGMEQEITEQMHLKDELLKKEELMIVQSRHAAMGEMISMIAHQWRQPISVIAMDANNMLIDIALGKLQEESCKKDAIHIVEQTQHLSDTIEDFRNFFRPNKNKEEMMVVDIVNEAEKFIHASLLQNSITLSVHNDCNIAVHMFSRELLQVFINILQNAKEALIEKTLEDRQITISIAEKSEHVVTLICDNAGGIDKHLIDKIFDPYFSTKDQQTGTGLGLYMSRTILEKHLNGSINVYNTDIGACFELSIPVKSTNNE